LREESSRYDAQLLAREARVDHLQFNYREAADLYAEAARIVSIADSTKAREYLRSQAKALVQLDDQFGGDNEKYFIGENVALEEAVSLLRITLAGSDAARVPLEWLSWCKIPVHK
jgi:hypothetical protein